MPSSLSWSSSSRLEGAFGSRAVNSRSCVENGASTAVYQVRVGNLAKKREYKKKIGTDARPARWEISVWLHTEGENCGPKSQQAREVPTQHATPRLSETVERRRPLRSQRVTMGEAPELDSRIMAHPTPDSTPGSCRWLGCRLGREFGGIGVIRSPPFPTSGQVLEYRRPHRVALSRGGRDLAFAAHRRPVQGTPLGPMRRHRTRSRACDRLPRYLAADKT